MEQNKDIAARLAEVQAKIRNSRSDCARLEGSLQQLEKQHQDLVQQLKAEGFATPADAAAYAETELGAIEKEQAALEARLRTLADEAVIA